VSLIQELAAAYYSQGSYGDSYNWFNKLVERQPEVAQYKQYCGNAAVILGRLDEAYTLFEEAAAQDTGFAAPFLSMGEVMSVRNYPDSAAALWRTGLGRGQSIPVHVELLIHLARCDRRMSERDSAAVKLTMARNSTARLLGQYPDHPRYLLRMAEILTEMNKPDSALIYYSAAEFFENRPYYQARIHLGAGKAADRAGRRKEAVEHYEEVFKIRAGYPTRKQAEKYINEIYR
jgi:tetratricopeptide (TPR) repeat protein